MKIAAFSPVYNEEALIRGCIESFRGIVDKHIILLASVPFYGSPTPEDKTKDIAEDLGAVVVSGSWKHEHEMRNCGNILLKDYDWVLVNDADMWWRKEELDKLLEEMRTTKADAIVSKQKAYWYDVDHALVDDKFMPVVAVRPKTRWFHIGCVTCPCLMSDVVVDHINWCKPKDVLKKVLTYSHANEYENGKEWYENNFIGWTEGNPAVMPDGKLFEVERSPLPEELRKFL